MRTKSHPLAQLGLYLFVTSILAPAAYAQISIEDVVAPEGDDTHTLDFNVSRAGEADSNVVIEYQTEDAADNSATAGEDYEAIKHGILRILAGTHVEGIAVRIFGDATPEQSESFLVQLTRAIAFNPTPDFAPAITLPVGAFPTTVKAGDMNGDGRMDLVAANLLDNNLSLLLGKADGGFDAAQQIVPGLAPRGHSIGDLDGDGRPDIIVPLEAEDRVMVVPNRAGLDFSGAWAIDIAGGPYASAIGDLDKDGRPDVVVANAGSSQISVLRNISSSGAIGFAAVRLLAVGSFPHSVGIEDLDGDGLGDIAVVNAGNNSVSVIRTSIVDGQLTFGAPTTLAAGAGADGVGVGDLDGDGKPDLAVANAYGADVSVFRNMSSSGTIQFAPAQHFAAGDGPYTAAVADLTGDGKPEIIVNTHGADGAAVLRNTSSPGALGFDPAHAFAGGDGAYQAAVADTDGNGTPDILIANSKANSVSVLRNSPGLTVSFSDNEAIGTLTDDDDKEPDAFKFTDRLKQPRNKTITSNTVTITGLSVPTRIFVTGSGSYSIGCTGEFTTNMGTISNGETVCVQHVTASTPKTSVHTRLTVGRTWDTFTSVTK